MLIWNKPKVVAMSQLLVYKIIDAFLSIKIGLHCLGGVQSWGKSYEKDLKCSVLLNNYKYRSEMWWKCDGNGEKLLIIWDGEIIFYRCLVSWTPVVLSLGQCKDWKRKIKHDMQELKMLNKCGTLCNDFYLRE